MFQHDPIFVAKNQDPTIIPDLIVIPANPKDYKWERQDIYFCPIRAPQWYLKKVDTLGLSGKWRLLFVPWERTPGDKEISSFTILAWIN